MADLGAALKRDPGDVAALMSRGELHLAAREPARATADFDAALKAAPDNSQLPVRIGMAYARAAMFGPALGELDRWVAAHPKDENLAQVLSVRCWTRAAWGQQLETALADCDYALKRDRVSDVLEARGLTLLRLGRLDEAMTQYNAALKLQPKSAEALLGRGLVKLKQGAKAEGAADIAQARAIEPNLLQEYQRLGLVPTEAPVATASGG